MEEIRVSILAEYMRVTGRRRCPICGKPDWCLISRDGSRAICARIESTKRAGEAGWLHSLENPQPIARVRVPAPAIASADLSEYANLFESQLQSAQLRDLAHALRLKVDSLRALRVGWDGQAYTFPMSDSVGRVVGIRRRFFDGRKLSVKGGREGCFVPLGVFGDQTDVVLVCEGPTDTAAALDAGFPAIGRPSCNGGREIVCELLKGREAVIVADDDAPGISGANRLAADLVRRRIAVRIIYPVQGKDLRSWHPTTTQLAMTIKCAKYWSRADG